MLSILAMKDKKKKGGWAGEGGWGHPSSDLMVLPLVSALKKIKQKQQKALCYPFFFVCVWLFLLRFCCCLFSFVLFCFVS